MTGQLAPLRLRLRIFFGGLYSALYGAIARAQHGLFPPDTAAGRLKQRFADRIRPQPQKKVTMLYRVLARVRPDATFVQIGANDGVMSDPLHEFVTATNWRGVLVEPVPFLFERLVRNYPKRPGLAFENVAIAATAGTRPFYYVPPDGAGPEWATGLGSFLREVVAGHAADIPDIEQRIVAQDVPCMTFAQLCEKHGIRGRLDVLNIDTEGYDYEILKTIDFARCRPLVLVYEWHLLKPADRAACTALLQAAGYEQHQEGLDAICINVRDLTPADAPVHEAWKILRDAAGVPA